MEGTSMKFGILVVFSISVCFGLMLATSDAAIDPENVVGVWLFDEGSGEVASDASENGLDGTIHGNPKWVDGKFGKALELDGSAAHVEVPEHENPREAITVSLWVKSLTENWNQHGWMIEKRNAYVLHPNTGTKNVAWAICNGGCWNKPRAWSDNAIGPADVTEWHMYTATWDSATGEWFIYIDAKEESAMNLDKTQLDADAGPVFIGRDSCCAGRFGNAVIDEVAIFNVALDQSEIENLMTKGLGNTVADVEAKDKMTTKWGDIKVSY